VIEAVNAGLTENNVSGFSVQQGSQPSKASISSPTIWIDRISSKRYGKQSRIPSVVSNEIIETKTYYQEIIFQVTGRKIRSTSDDANTQTSTDVLGLLVSYFNGQEGIDKLVSLDMNCINITDVRTPTSMSDSQLYEKDPSFDLTITLIQSDVRALPAVDVVTATIEQV
jgi:hypothetical protein